MPLYFNDFHRWNCLITPPIGFMLNFLLLWLIFRKTPKEMQKHSRILLQTCLLDILLVIMQTIGEPSMAYQSAFIAVFFDGYLFELFASQNIGAQLLSMFYFIWLSMSTTVMYGISVQFLYRYLMLNCDYQLALWMYLLLLMVPFGIGLLALLFPINWSGNYNRAMFENFISSDAKPIYISANLQNTMMVINIWFSTICMIFSANYVIICFCGWKMVRFVSAHSGISARLKELNRQLTRNLIIMALFPIFLQLISAFVTFYFVFIERNASPNFTFAICFYPGLFYHWLPVLNPAVSIYVNRPYRDAVLRLFLKFCKSPPVSPADA